MCNFDDDSTARTRIRFSLMSYMPFMGNVASEGNCVLALNSVGPLSSCGVINGELPSFPGTRVPVRLETTSGFCGSSVYIVCEGGVTVADVSADVRRQEKELCASIKSELKKSCAGNVRMLNLVNLLRNFRYESLSGTSFGQPFARGHFYSVDYMVNWLQQSVRLFALLTGVDLKRFLACNVGYSGMCSVWFNALILAVGPYRVEKVDCRSDSAFKGFRDTDCNSLARMVGDLHAAVCSDSTELLEVSRRRLGCFRPQ